MQSDTKDELQTIGKFIIYKNALIYGNSTYQISNISSIWIADKSYAIKHKFPTWILVVGAIGLSTLIFGSSVGWIMRALIGFGLLGAAYYGFAQYESETAISKFAIGIQLNSGHSSLFTASDQTFVIQVARALTDAIAERHAATEKTVINFDNKSIQIENVNRANIIGGDVNNSLVESI